MKPTLPLYPIKWIKYLLLLFAFLWFGGPPSAWATEDPLITAVRKGDLAEIKEIIEVKKSSPIDVADKNKRTPLHLAVEMGNEALVDYLLSKGADPNKQNRWNNTPLIRALFKNRPNLAKKLIQAGTDVERKNQWGSNALNWAARNGHTEILKELLEKGASVKEKNQWGSSALIWAAKESSIEAVQALILAGADVNHKNNAHKSAFDYAKEKGKEDIADFLKSFKEKADTEGISADITACSNALILKDKLLAEKLAEMVNQISLGLKTKFPHIKGVAAKKKNEDLGPIKADLVHDDKGAANPYLYLSLDLPAEENQRISDNLLKGLPGPKNFATDFHVSLMVANSKGGNTKLSEGALTLFGKFLKEYLENPKNDLKTQLFRPGSFEIFTGNPASKSFVVLRPTPESEALLKELQGKILDKMKMALKATNSEGLAEISQFHSGAIEFKPHLTLYKNFSASPGTLNQVKAKLEQNLDAWKGSGDTAIKLPRVTVKVPPASKLGTDVSTDVEPTFTKSVYGSVIKDKVSPPPKVHTVSAKMGRLLNAAEVGHLIADMVKPGPPEQFARTKELAQDPLLKPFLKRTIPGTPDREFYFSQVIRDSNSRSKVIMYTQDEKGVYYPRIFYKSQSDGGWRSCPGQEGPIYSKGLHYHYTQETKPVPELIEALEKNEDSTPGGAVPYGKGIDLISEKFDYFQLKKEGINNYDQQMHLFDDKGALAPFQKYMPGNGLPANAEAEFSAMNFDSPQLKGFVPDFSKVTQKYDYQHTLLGDTSVMVFEGTLQGRKVEWHMARNYQNKVWIDRINFKDAKINSYGVREEIINTGALTNKPLEYMSQLGDYEGYTKVPGTHYGDITKLLGKLRPIQDFKKTQAIPEPLTFQYFQQFIRRACLIQSYNPHC